MEKDNSYKQIFKSTSLFGGVQVVTIAVTIIRSKFIAILLGPAGIGVVGLLNSTIGLITALTNFGIERSSVKNIAAANVSEDYSAVSRVVSVTRNLLWITGLLGAIITFVFSGALSELTFGNKDYTIAFVWISITLLLNQLSSGQVAVLRGMRKLKYMASASLLGALLGLFVSVPLYYFLGLDGIVPAILSTSIISLLISTYYSKKIKIDKIKVSKLLLKTEGKEILSMGLILSLSSIVVMAASYIVRIYINSNGSIDDVGFYNAGFAIVGSYFGVIFTSISTDYYPRLAKVANDIKKANTLMNEQSEMTLLILAPILLAFLVFIKWIIIILYSSKFTPINEMIMWASLGVFFKASSYGIGVIYISKGHSKILFFTEFISNSMMLIFNILGFRYLGLEGLGISYLLSFLFTFGFNYLIISKKYSFSYSSKFKLIFKVQLIISTLGFFVMRFIPFYWNYLFGILLITVSCWFSYVELNKRMDINSTISKFLKK